MINKHFFRDGFKIGTFAKQIRILMETREIIKEISRLPVNKRMLIVERTLKSIIESENKNSMAIAVNALLDDYRNDKELTVFTNLDYESFYEAR